MKAILHILTRPDDGLAADIISRQRAGLKENSRLDVVDLTAPSPDYHDLLEKIFRADSIAVW